MRSGNVFFFFFSSRRRHTRYIGDWSSDVCSSDLTKGSVLKTNLRDLSIALGGPPKLIFVKNGEPRPRFDTYADAAITEAIDAFMLARSSICRTHMYLIGSGIIKQHPEVVNWPDDPEIRRIFVSNVEGYFWEHAETSYIRLASFWDRVGQLL